MDELVLVSKKGNPITTSLLVAKRFGKQHKNVIRDIKAIMEKDSAQNWAQFYHSGSYVDSSGKRLALVTTNNGFAVTKVNVTPKGQLYLSNHFKDMLCLEKVGITS